jgi:predicted NUDIX family NTP pyrophosphohydrolase
VLEKRPERRSLRPFKISIIFSFLPPLGVRYISYSSQVGWVEQSEIQQKPLGSAPLNPTYIVLAWAVEGDCEPEKMKSNTFTMEWPPRSGRQQEFPEVDRAGWFTIEAAKQKINPAQISFLEELQRLL